MESRVNDLLEGKSDEEEELGVLEVEFEVVEKMGELEVLEVEFEVVEKMGELEVFIEFEKG